jgi:hypothetical protein
VFKIKQVRYKKREVPMQVNITGVGLVSISETATQKIISNGEFRFAWSKTENKLISFRFNFGIFKESERVKSLLIDYCK